MSLYRDAPSATSSPRIAIPSKQLRARRQSGTSVSESYGTRRSTTVISTSNRSVNVRVRGPAGQSPPFGGKSVESRVLIDIDSPNFKTKEPKQHDEIVNSLRNLYLNEYVGSKRKLSTNSVNSPAESNEEEEEDVGGGQDAISCTDAHLSSLGGDITRDIYKIGSRNEQAPPRNKSFDDMSLVQRQHRGSTASGLNVPGGFRREYIVSRVRKEGGMWSEAQTFVDNSRQGTPVDKIPFLTRNFLEFLYVEGHFAGETFDNEFDFGPLYYSPGETVPLLSGDTELQGQVPVKVKTSTFKAFLLMIKSFVGTGILFLPNAFYNGGLLFSIGMLLFCSLYSYWCYYILIKSKVSTNVASFGDIGALLYGPSMKFIILLSLVLTQLGFAGAYVVFTAKNLTAFIHNVLDWNHVTITHMLLVQLLIFIPLSFVRNFSKLSITSLFANAFTIGGLFIVAYYTARHLAVDLGFRPEEGVILFLNPKKWTMFIGTAIFAFEGIGLIIPVQDSMRHPEKFPMVLALVMIVTTILFISIGTLGYLAYGKYVKSVLLLNLPQDILNVNLIQLFYSVSIMLSTPLQLFPVIAIIENKVFPKFIKVDNKYPGSANFQLIPNSGRLSWKVKWTKNLVRALIVSFVILISYFGVDDLDLFVSIVGCVACIPLVYIYPPLLHLRSCSKPTYKRHSSWKNTFLVTLDYLLIVFGAASMFYTTSQFINH